MADDSPMTWGKLYGERSDTCCNRADPAWELKHYICIHCNEYVHYCINGIGCGKRMQEKHQLVCKKCKCKYCGTRRLPSDIKKCSGCKKVYYCNETCQKKHWKHHKRRCSHSG